MAADAALELILPAEVAEVGQHLLELAVGVAVREEDRWDVLPLGGRPVGGGTLCEWPQAPNPSIAPRAVLTRGGGGDPTRRWGAGLPPPSDHRQTEGKITLVSKEHSGLRKKSEGVGRGSTPSPRPTRFRGPPPEKCHLACRPMTRTSPPTSLGQANVPARYVCVKAKRCQNLRRRISHFTIFPLSMWANAHIDIFYENPNT